MGRIQLAYPPQTREHLWWAVRAMFGVTIPRTRVCPDHCSPFDAFADAYFGICTIGQGDSYEISRAIWHASRGLAGKSKTLSILGLTFSYLIGADLTVLGGSMAQSYNVHEYMSKGMEREQLGDDLVLDMTATRIQLTNKGRMRPLPASQRNVRGPHPSVLLMDEVDEMELDIYDAALGQPMPQPNYLGNIVETMTIISSTWQNADGCVLAGTPIFTRRGYSRIEDVRIGDQVPTREGWRPVTNVIDTGYQECVSVELRSGRRLTCTPWHPVWTDAGGWVEAAALTPGSHVATLVTRVGRQEMPLADPDALGAPSSALPGTLPGIGQGEIVAVITDRLRRPHLESSEVVLASSDRFEMSGIDAGVSDTPPSPDVIQGEIVRDSPAELDPDPAVSQEDAPTGDEITVGLVSVPVLADLQRPDHAVVGVEVEGYTFTDDEVVKVLHRETLLPTWDLTVADTHEYVANGILVHNTLTEIFRRAEEQEPVNDRGDSKTPIYRWCYRENLVENNPPDQYGKPTGWLTPKTVQEKIDTVSAEMFRIEYDLGEPSIGNRAIDTELLDLCFVDEINGKPYVPLANGEVHKKDWDEWRFFEYDSSAIYAAGADWAKEEDKTVITIIRVDTPKRRVVYTARINRTNYPTMIGLFNRELRRYKVGLNGVWHDSTGLGNVVDDYLDSRARAFTMTGDKRTKLLSNYINALEKVTWEYPKMLTTIYTKHKYCSTGDLYSHSQKFHLPDEVCAGALAEHGAKRVARASAPVAVPKDGTVGKHQRHFEHVPENPKNLESGEPPVKTIVLTV